MGKRKTVSKQEWTAARLALLDQEKAHSRARDALTRARQALPRVKVEQDYCFNGAGGQLSLGDLFQARNQLIVYHFMFDDDWDEGCKSCSFIADHVDPSVVHIAHRDVGFAVVSKAPWTKLEAFRNRMGWRFNWVSSAGTTFNRDFHVSFTQAELDTQSGYYNFRGGALFPVREAPGISVFEREEDGSIFHTYSAYARGLEDFISAYNLLDIVPRGRDEAGLVYGMEWLRHKDRYDDADFVDPYADKL